MSTFGDITNINPLTGSITLNAGLPWTNPLKIQIGSDEHILDTTINRGLMMLLNNDYYLDMKTSIMSKELGSVIDNEKILVDILSSHVNNTEIHGKSSTPIIIDRRHRIFNNNYH